jgi:hypothetical protein
MWRIDFEIDHAKRRVVRTVHGDPDGDQIGEEMLRFLDAHREIIAYDTVTDWRRYIGRFEWRDLSDFAKAFGERYRRYLESEGAYRGPVRGAFVGLNEMAPALVGAIQHLYANRAMRAFTSLEAAHAWLDAPDASSAPISGSS